MPAVPRCEPLHRVQRFAAATACSSSGVVRVGAIHAGVVLRGHDLCGRAWLGAPVRVADVKIRLELSEVGLVGQGRRVHVVDLRDVDPIQHRPRGVLVAPLARQRIVAAWLRAAWLRATDDSILEEMKLKLPEGGLLREAWVPLLREAWSDFDELHGPLHAPVAIALGRILAIIAAPEAADHLTLLLRRACARHRAAAPIAIMQVSLEIGEARLLRQSWIPLRACVDSMTLCPNCIVVARLARHRVVARSLAEKFWLALCLSEAAPQVNIRTTVRGCTPDAEEVTNLHALYGVGRHRTTRQDQEQGD